MAIGARSKCTASGCRVLLPRPGLCDEHKAERRKAVDRNRGTRQARGYDKRWYKLRAQHLDAHPFCEDCEAEGVLTPATVVDHKVPHRMDEALLYDPGNLSSKCKHHHDQKTAREDGGFGNPIVTR